jgi:hypothetical protein
MRRQYRDELADGSISPGVAKLREPPALERLDVAAELVGNLSLKG